jgi:hypothetical protein
MFRALGGTRTPNLLIRSQMLYPLSYKRVTSIGRQVLGELSNPSDMFCWRLVHVVIRGLEQSFRNNVNFSN